MSKVLESQMRAGAFLKECLHKNLIRGTLTLWFMFCARRTEAWTKLKL